MPIHHLRTRLEHPSCGKPGDTCAQNTVLKALSGRLGRPWRCRRGQNNSFVVLPGFFEDRAGDVFSLGNLKNVSGSDARASKNPTTWDPNRRQKSSDKGRDRA